MVLSTSMEMGFCIATLSQRTLSSTSMGMLGSQTLVSRASGDRKTRRTQAELRDTCVITCFFELRLMSLAPEVMCRSNHGVAADYFALGVIIYEMMMGRRPYTGRTRKEIRDQILSKQVQIRRHEAPEGWSSAAVDFVNQLIQRKPQARLGLNGPEEVKAHPWIRDFPWEKLNNRELEPPYKPNEFEDNFDAKYTNAIDPWRDENSEQLHQNALLLKSNTVQNLFNGYDFDSTNVEEKTSTSHQNYSRKASSVALPSSNATIGDLNSKAIIV
eukprot:TRINITY_DN6968_c0_g1_i1.p1 TRINITY_DN6968_c0_g1~~TRINITY_DN6968_c0_g1_i1.p1  ORF type:complete len:272 (-),score=28.36 TRINITY_DN6968_c0_g1_i1:141-956(-)